LRLAFLGKRRRHRQGMVGGTGGLPRINTTARIRIVKATPAATKKAWSNPVASAWRRVAAAPPAWVRWIWWAAVVQATVRRAAIPTEPPTSGATLTTLAASPESAGLTRERPSATKGTETRLNPKAAMIKAPKTWPK